MWINCVVLHPQILDFGGEIPTVHHCAAVSHSAHDKEHMTGNTVGMMQWHRRPRRTTRLKFSTEPLGINQPILEINGLEMFRLYITSSDFFGGVAGVSCPGSCHMLCRILLLITLILSWFGQHLMLWKRTGWWYCEWFRSVISWSLNRNLFRPTPCFVCSFKLICRYISWWNTSVVGQRSISFTCNVFHTKFHKSSNQSSAETPCNESLYIVCADINSR